MYFFEMIYSVLLLQKIIASNVYTNKFILGACSNSNTTEEYSNAVQCSSSCLDDDCLGFVVYEGLDKDKKCSQVTDVQCLPADMSIDCQGSSNDVKLYLKEINSEVINTDIKDDSITHFNSCPVTGNQQSSTDIIIFNNWLLVRESVSGKAWIVIQRRASSDVDFYRTWDDYEHGFGQLAGNFWLGLDKIHHFCSSKCKLRFDFEFKDRPYWASYAVSVSGATENYKIRIHKKSFIGNANDSFDTSANNGADGMAFTTYDKDNDRFDDFNCADMFHGAWWYNSCHLAHLNGIWGSTEYGKGLNWYSITGQEASVTFSQMKIRPV